MDLVMEKEENDVFLTIDFGFAKKRFFVGAKQFLQEFSFCERDENINATTTTTQYGGLFIELKVVT